MRIIKFEITPNGIKTGEQYFTHNDRVLVYRGMVGQPKIEGLMLQLENANGSIKQIGIDRFNSGFEQDITHFGYAFLKWANTDIEYEIEFELN